MDTTILFCVLLIDFWSAASLTLSYHLAVALVVWGSEQESFEVTLYERTNDRSAINLWWLGWDAQAEEIEFAMPWSSL